MPRTISSLLWKYFDKTGPGFRASCKVCQQKLSYQSTTGNLKTHLKSRHLDHYVALCNKEDPPEVTDQLSSTYSDPVTKRIYATGSRPNQRRSPVWKYFIDVDDESRVQCKLCDIISEGKTPYKLKLHLKNNHYKEYEEIENLYTNGNENSDIPDDDSNSSIKFATEVLNYFEQNHDGSRCTICEQTTESTVEEMKSHLEEEHPGILISILNNKQENTEADDTYTEVIYLEDEQKQSKHKRRKIINFPQKVETKTDSRPDIDSFLNYLSVLLRNVAKDDMPKLQLDVISRVLNAQMSPVQKQQSKTCNCKETGDLQISDDVGKSEVNVSST